MQWSTEPLIRAELELRSTCAVQVGAVLRVSLVVNSFPLQIENVPIKAKPNMSNVQHLELLPLSLKSGKQQSNCVD